MPLMEISGILCLCVWSEGNPAFPSHVINSYNTALACVQHINMPRFRYSKVVRLDKFVVWQPAEFNPPFACHIVNSYNSVVVLVPYVNSTLRIQGNTVKLIFKLPDATAFRSKSHPPFSIHIIYAYNSM